MLQPTAPIEEIETFLPKTYGDYSRISRTNRQAAFGYEDCDNGTITRPMIALFDDHVYNCEECNNGEYPF